MFRKKLKFSFEEIVLCIFRESHLFFKGIDLNINMVIFPSKARDTVIRTYNNGDLIEPCTKELHSQDVPKRKNLK